MLILLYLTRAQSSLKICTRSNKGKVVSLFNHPSIFSNVKQNEHNKLAGKKKKKKRPVRQTQERKGLFLNSLN